MDRLLDEDMDVFDQIDQDILDRNYQQSVSSLLNEDLEFFNQIDPQKLIQDANLVRDSDVSEISSTQVKPDSNVPAESTPLNTQIFNDGIEDVNTSTQFGCSPMNVSDPPLDEAIFPLLTPAYDEEYTVSQILRMFDNE